MKHFGRFPKTYLAALLSAYATEDAASEILAIELKTF
jgi:hypothetical protein